MTAAPFLWHQENDTTNNRVFLFCLVLSLEGVITPKVRKNVKNSSGCEEQKEKNLPISCTQESATTSSHTPNLSCISRLQDKQKILNQEKPAVLFSCAFKTRLSGIVSERTKSRIIPYFDFNFGVFTWRLMMFSAPYSHVISAPFSCAASINTMQHTLIHVHVPDDEKEQ